MEHDQRRDEANFQLFVRMVVHDLNNMLGAISGHASYIEAIAEPGGEIQDSARIISQAAVRAVDLAREIPRFAGESSVCIEPVDVHAVLREVAALVKGPRVSVETGATSAIVSGDARQVFQMLFNLVMNARDAMPHGGDLRLSTAEGESGTLRIDVADTGQGIPERLRDQIFEPFFTTRPESTGSGLGLTIVKRVVEQHGGRIAVASVVGRGTTFSIWLPLR